MIRESAPRPPTAPSKTPHKPAKAPSRKHEKRISKHATLLSRITKPTAATSKVTKRRRPSRKLVTGLDSLADALPRATDGDGEEEAWEGIVAEGGGEDGARKIKHRSLKSRPGAGKKKEKLVAMERERFAKNLAQMAAGRVSVPGPADADGGVMIVDGREEGEGTKKGRGSADRWAAIRGFISQTMERRVGGEVGVGGKK
ncbi:hypothetical protein HO173_006439 [Letharia columbiana]|uniref:Ribosome biogenesis protein SLX9 n=1 Tax=Letharia columbiana TaxID=112416 RepID=A0A8H6L4F9_9LECA|nr:uncharacterized protein HO173_006439 [Letharia columbiana]KAF6235245.1 hypothetical protein HO173_006439 [Letharia columbiana]